MIFLRHHLDDGLKNKYLTIKDPLVLWKNLKEIYNHQKTVILPKAHYDLMHLRLQDFRTVAKYNSAFFKIRSKLQLCGEKITESDMLEKTYQYHKNHKKLSNNIARQGKEQFQPPANYENKCYKCGMKGLGHIHVIQLTI